MSDAIAISGVGSGRTAQSSGSSLASSYGSPSADMAELRDLKNNFNSQEQLLGQLRDVLQTNSQRLQTKEKDAKVDTNACVAY